MMNEKYYQANKKVLQYESMVRHFDCQSDDCDAKLIAIIKEGLEYSIENLNVIDENWSNKASVRYMFEVSNSSLCGAVGNLLVQQKQLKKSQRIIDFFTDLVFDDKWKSNRADFIFILLTMKAKASIIQIANDKNIWNADGYTQFCLVEAIYKLKISGYAHQFLAMQKIAERDGDKQMLGFINRYLEKIEIN